MQIGLLIQDEPQPARGNAAISLYEEPLAVACAKASPYADGMSPRELGTSRAIRLEASPEHAPCHNCWFGENAHVVRADTMAFTTQLLHESGWWAVGGGPAHHAHHGPLA